MRTASLGCGLFLFLVSIVACGGDVESPSSGDGSPSGDGTSTSPSGGRTEIVNATDGEGGSAEKIPKPSAPKTSAPPTARASSAACTGTRPPGDEADPRPEDTCQTDAECTDGLEGRCSFWGGKKSCTYHACTQDSDCGSGTEVCGCGLGQGKRNVCLSLSKCRTNDDCGSGQYCALSALPGVPVGDGAATFYGQTWGYFCTTGGDVCRSGADCAAEQHDHSCVFYTTQSRWACGGGP